MRTASRIPLSIQVIYGLGVSYAVFDQIFAQWVLTYYLPPQKFSFQAFMSPLFIALALMISRFVDMVSDPLVGYWSDRTNTRWGRRIPFIALGAVPLALSTVGFFFPPKSGGLGSFAFLACIGSLFFIFYTIVGAPYNALIPELSKSREDRLNLSTAQAIFRLVYSAVAMILPGILIAVLGKGDDEKGLRLMVIILSLFALVGLFLVSFGVDEKKYSGGQVSESSLTGSLKIIFGEKSFLWYLGGLTFFFIGFNILRATMNYFIVDIMGKGTAMITPVSALFFGTSALFFYPVKKLSYKVGYRLPMLISLLMLFVLSRALGMLGKSLPVDAGYAVFALCGIPVAGAAFIFPQAMLSEISAYVSSKTRENIGGIFFGIQGFFLKMAFLISIAILPAILVWDGSVPFLQMMVSVPKQPEAVGVYRSALASSICFAFSFVCYWFYKEKKLMNDIKREIACLNNQAFECAENENWGQALECCNKALSLCTDPEVPVSTRARVLYNKAMVLIKKGDVDRGTEVLKTASDLVPDDAHFLNDCGLLCYNNQCFCEAGFYYSMAERTGQLSGALLNNIGVLNFTNGEYEQAKEYFERAVTADSGSLDAWYNLADTYEVLGEKEKCEFARERYFNLEKKSYIIGEKK